MQNVSSEFSTSWWTESVALYGWKRSVSWLSLVNGLCKELLRRQYLKLLDWGRQSRCTSSCPDTLHESSRWEGYPYQHLSLRRASAWFGNLAECKYHNPRCLKDAYLEDSQCSQPLFAQRPKRHRLARLPRYNLKAGWSGNWCSLYWFTTWFSGCEPNKKDIGKRYTRKNNKNKSTLTSLRPIVTRTIMTKDKIVRAEKVAQRPWSNGIHGRGFKVNQDGTRNILVCFSLFVIDRDTFKLHVIVAHVTTILINAVFIWNDLPELGTCVRRALTSPTQWRMGG